MSFLIDTDVCSAFLKGDGRVFHRFTQHGEQLCLSVVSLAELSSWAMRAAAPPSRLLALRDMLSGISILPVTETIARTCGELRAGLLDLGRPVATADLLIAATALVLDLTW